MTLPGRSAGSFRDPCGFVFERDGIVYRQINTSGDANYDRLIASGLYDALTREHLLIPHVEVDRRYAAQPEIAYRIIRPVQLAFVSYPYEWCFSQLRDAALATLRIQKIAMAHGMSLRDASAYNIQFHAGEPTLIDTLSFEAIREGEPWVAYRQFCQHFLAPLAIMSYRDHRLGQLLRIHVDGVPLPLARELLPLRTWLRPSLGLHLRAHARSVERRSTPSKAGGRGKTFSRRAFEGIVESLFSAVRGLRTPSGPSEWVGYYDEAASYSAEAAGAKAAAVGRLLGEYAKGNVWDLGANTGQFSRMAAAYAGQIVSFDVDPFCVEASYEEMKRSKEENLLPLVLDLTNPSPPLGWAGEERLSLAERGPADLIMALALVHHLAIASNVPLADIARFFATLGDRLIVEWVPKSDPMVRRLLAWRDDVFHSYTRAGFEQAFAAFFRTEQVEEIAGSERAIFAMTRL